MPTLGLPVLQCFRSLLWDLLGPPKVAWSASPVGTASSLPVLASVLEPELSSVTISLEAAWGLRWIRVLHWFYIGSTWFYMVLDGSTRFYYIRMIL